MDEKQKLQIALQLYFERKYKGDVEVSVKDGGLSHLYSIHISVEFNEFKMFSHFDLFDFFSGQDLEEQIRKSNETILQSYDKQINQLKNIIRQ